MLVLQRTCLAMLAGYVDKADTTFRLLRDDGAWRTIYSRPRVTKHGKDGAPLTVNGICLDITGIHPGPQSSHGFPSVSDFDYHTMLANSPDLFIRLTKDMKPVYVNPVIVRYLGKKPEDRALSDKPTSLDIMGNFKEVLKRNVRRVFAERTVSREALELVLPDGREIFGEYSFWPEYDTEGKVYHAMVQFRDYTKKRRLEQRVQINEQRQNALYRLTLMESNSEQDILRFVMENVLKLTSSRSGFMFFPEEPDSDKELPVLVHGPSYVPGDGTYAERPAPARSGDPVQRRPGQPPLPEH